MSKQNSEIDINLSSTKKQPNMLYLLSFIEMCERFGHYAMRGIVVLYMTKFLLFSNEKSYGIFAGFSALLFFSPFVGGYLADKFIGTKRAIILGGILLTLGYGLLAIPGTEYFYYALSLIVIGSGFFIPNMSGIIGQLYEKNDARRDGGYSIFYGAINLGALIAPIVIASVVMRLGWNAGFILAALGALLGTGIFYFSLWNVHPAGNQPPTNNQNFLMTLGVLMMIPIFAEMIKTPNLSNKIVFLLGTCFFLLAIKKSFGFSKVQRNCLLVCFFLTFFSIIFETLLMQTAMSMTIFVENNVNRDFGFWHMPTIMFQSLNPIFIIFCAPFVSKVWLWLDAKNLNPSIPTKFALGTMLMGFSFIILPFAILHSPTGKISFVWIALSYLLQSLGELLVSPVGMSMIAELSPPAMVGLMMGLWYFATAVASSLAGIISQWTVVSSNDNAPIIMAPAYAHVFGLLGAVSIAAGLLIFLIIPKLKTILSMKNHANEMTDVALSNLHVSSS
ncbi:MAG: peptide MFS transporter [Gammaproteobacteria bacterium]|nr:peptide MFS transporter [Gammaproteobacteria bacterium]